MIVFPIGVEPVKPIFLISGCSDMACPIEEPGPGSMLITPGGKPAFTDNSANFKAVRGVTWNTKVVETCKNYSNTTNLVPKTAF